MRHFQEHQIPEHVYVRQEEKDLQFLYEEAFLAFQIVLLIKRTKKEKGMSILRDTILSGIQSQYPQISSQSKQNILQLFDEGILLNPKVYSQQRSLLGLNKKNRFKFHPTCTITKKIFTIVEKPHFKVITGYYGLSKSTIGILHQKLSQKIFDYVICKKLLKGMKFSDSRIQTYCRFMVFTFYLNINLYLNEEQISELLYEQFTQRVKKGLQKEGIHKFEAEKIRYFFRDSLIKFHLIIDQFNVVTSAIRRSGYEKCFYDSLESLYNYLENCMPRNRSSMGYLLSGMKSDKEIQQETIEKKQIIDRIKNFQRVIKKMQNIFPKITALSSCNIQDKLLNQLTFDKDHPKTTRFKFILSSSQIFSDKNYQTEIIDFLIHQLQEKELIRFEITQRNKKQVLNKKSIQKIKNKLLEEISKQLTQKVSEIQDYQKLRIYQNQQKLQIHQNQQKILQIYCKQTENQDQCQKDPQTQIHKKYLKNQNQFGKIQQKCSSSRQFETMDSKNETNDFKIESHDLKNEKIKLKNNLIKVILSVFLQNDSSFTLTPLEILQYLDNINKSSVYLITQQNIDKDQTLKFFRTVKYSINNSSKSRIIEGLEQFRKKQPKLLFLRTLFLYNITNELIESLQVHEKIYKEVKIKLDDFKIKFRTGDIIDLADCNLFQIAIQSENGIKKQYVKIIFPKQILTLQDINQIQDTYLNDMVQVQAQILMSRVISKSGRGQLIQALLISAISQSKTVLLLKNQVEKKNSQTQTQLKMPNLEGNNTLKQTKSNISEHQLMVNPFAKIQPEKLSNPYSSFLKQQLQKQDYLKHKKDSARFVFDNIQKKKLFFTPIPKNTKFKKNVPFFHNVLNGIQFQENCSYIILPMKKNKLSKEQESMAKNIDQTSKSIDFLIVSSIKNEIKIFVFDISTEVDKNQKKIANFLRNYEQFQDKNNVQFIKKEKKYKIQVQYILVNTLKEQEKKLKEYLPKLGSIDRNLHFQQLPDNSIEVKSKNEKPQVLKKIIALVFEDFLFFTSEKKQKESKLFKTISSMIKLYQFLPF